MRTLMQARLASGSMAFHPWRKGFPGHANGLRSIPADDFPELGGHDRPGSPGLWGPGMSR